MLRAPVICLFALPLLAGADDLVKPDKISIHTWVREDMFAGWIGNDMVTFERGVAKVDRFLSDHPDDRNALAWKYLQASKYMIRARAAKDDAEYAKQLAIAKDLRTRVFAGGLQDPGPYIIIGSSLVNTGDAAPDKDRDWMYRDALELLSKVPQLQGDVFNSLPAHMRGELWAQLAYVSAKLGDTAARDRSLQNLLTLTGSPYESRARAWQNAANLAKEK